VCTLSGRKLTNPHNNNCRTYDLSTTVSDGGIDDYPELSKILHLFSGSVDIIPGQIEDFIRQQARTQGLSLTEQLDNGVRFIDFRNMLEGDGSWYSLHCVQSNKKALDYLKEVRDWLIEHDGEVVVFWITKHGSDQATGDDAYPNVSKEDKQKYWKVREKEQCERRDKYFHFLRRGAETMSIIGSRSEVFLFLVASLLVVSLFVASLALQ